MITLQKLQREIDQINKQIRNLPPENATDVDYDRITPEDRKIIEIGVHHYLTLKNGGEITAEERMAMIECEKTFIKYLEPVCILRKEKRGSFKPQEPIH